VTAILHRGDGAGSIISPVHFPFIRSRVDVANPRANVLMVSALISMPYRVMRAAEGAGTNVYVLGSTKSMGLRHSRYCKKFILAQRPMAGRRDLDLANEINRCVADFDIEMVLAGDVDATRSLLAIKDLLHAPCFPSPDLEQFDYLNNKWHFTNLCRSLGMLCPHTWLVRDPVKLLAKLDSGEIPLPAIVKPVNHDGGLGVISLDAANARKQIGNIDYLPILVQEPIPGLDIGASIYCEGGHIKAFIAHQLRRATYRILDEPDILPTLTRFAQHIECDGVFNFDMRLAPNGQIYYLECNPRFFFKISLSMLAGINFIKYGFGTARDACRPQRIGNVRLPKALALAMLTPWRITMRDLNAVWHLWGDPLSYLREAIGIDKESPETRRFPEALSEKIGITGLTAATLSGN
jgi:ATP-grasp in the biosynthetic pathway with Ter operon